MSSELFFYTLDVNPLYKIKSNATKNLILYLNEISRDQIVKICTKTRNEICDKFNITHSTLSKCFKTLKELNVIKGNKGKYMINPEMFYKGSINNIDIAIEKFNNY
jgi:predicted transcriptional regulator